MALRLQKTYLTGSSRYKRLEYKKIPLARCAPLIAIRFRERAAAWWHQSNTTRVRAGKTKIVSWV